MRPRPLVKTLTVRTATAFIVLCVDRKRRTVAPLKRVQHRG